MMTTEPLAGTPAACAVKDPFVEPAAIVIVAGTWASAVALDSET
jgi:hypothetical protein